MEQCIAVVTGAAGGLGSHLVTNLAGAGAIVYGVDVKAPGERIEGVTYIQADLTSRDGVERVYRQLGPGGRVDLLINGAGAFRPDPEIDAVWDVFRQMVDRNTATTVMLTLRLEELLACGRDALVLNIASTDGVVASGGQDCEIGVSHDVLYATSKGAVVAFTRALAMKWAPRGIRVNALCPTIFRSPMTAPLLQEQGKEQQLASKIPLGRLCTTDDIAEAVNGIYRMRMTTGHLFPIDGGYLCR